MVKSNSGTALTTLILGCGLALGTISGAFGQDVSTAMRDAIAQNVAASKQASTDESSDDDGAHTARSGARSGNADKPKYHTTVWHRKRMGRLAAIQMAKEDFFDVTAAADPALVADVCQYPHAAEILAKHRRIARIADADHYLCRRLTRWSHVTDVMIGNPNIEHVLTLDPEGIYYAIKRDPAVSRQLARHVQFSDMLTQNPDLGKVIADNMQLPYSER